MTARIKTYLSPRRLFVLLQKIADKNIGAVERAFLESVKVALDSIDTARLATALERGDVNGALDAAGVNGQLPKELKARFESTLRKAFLQAAVTSEAVVVPGMVRAGMMQRTQLRFDLVNMRAVEHARIRSGKLIREIEEGTRRSIRSIVARGIREGITIAESKGEIAKSLLKDVKASYGLTQKQYVAYDKVRGELRLRASVQAAVKAGGDIEAVAADHLVTPQKVYAILRRPPIDAEQAEARAERYGKKLLNYRAKMIAQTETIVSSNAGNRETMRRAVADGLAGRGTMKRFWLVTPDDRLCPICAAIPDMNPNGVSLDEPFATPEGPVMIAGSAHPKDRCGERYQIVTEDIPLAIAA